MGLAISLAAGIAIPFSAAIAQTPAQTTPKPATTNEDAKSEDGKLQRIVVTANKRVEKLESVPLSISVLAEEVIARNNVREMEDIVSLSSALNVNTGTTSANNTISMRGVGTQTNSIGVEGDVVVIMDDIPIANQFQAFRDLADIARVEVLKGPQSTLFGRSAIAGGLIIVTKPISGPPQGRATLLTTDDGERRYSVSYGGYLNEGLGLRFAASHADFPGNLNNLTTGQKVNGSRGKTFMAKLAWRPAGGLDVDVMPYYNDSSNTRSPTALRQFAIRNTGTNAATQGAIGERQQGGAGGVNTLGPGGSSLPVFLIPANSPGGFPATASSINAIPASVALAGINPTEWNRDIRRDHPGGLESTNKGVGAKLTYALPNDATLMSITSFDKFNAKDFLDRDFGDVPVQVVPTTAPVTGSSILTIPVSVGNPQQGTYDITTRTQEFRLVSPDTGAFRYLAGVWIAKDETDRYFNRGDCRPPTACSSSSVGSPVVYIADVYHDNKAIFGQATWEFTPGYTLLAGARVAWEKSGYNFARNFFTQATRDTFTPGAAATNVFSVPSEKDRAITGKLSLQRQFNSNWMGYVMLATGHKGIAYDLLSGLSSNTSAPVPPEEAFSTEMGLKANLLDDRVSIATSVFNTEFRDYQQAMTVSLGEGAGTVTRLSSLPKIRTRGFELDMNAQLTRDFSMSLSYAYTEARIQEWKSAACYNDSGNVRVGTTIFAANGSIAGRNSNCFPAFAGDTQGVQDLSGAPMFNAPRHKVVISGSYDIRMANMPFDAFINGNLKHQSSIITNIIQDPDSRAPEYTIVDLGLGIRDKKDRYKLTLLVKNLFDRQYVINGFGSTPAYRGSAALPATVSISAWRPERDAFRFLTLRLDVKF